MSTILEIKDKTDIVKLIGKTYELIGQGRYLHAKQHDSLVVDTVQQTYFWNSKSENGDAIDWAGRNELGYNGQWNSSDPALFKEAITWLARFAGLPDPQFKPEDAQARAERLTRERLMTLAANYYQANLTPNTAYDYAISRGFTAKTMAQYLGYADGKLWQQIADQDRPTAAEMGLIYQTERKRWKDAIYKGNLVYLHFHRGQVEYMTGRYLAEKRHCNLRAPKRMFWADWPGYGRPLVICEGQADALSLAQLGVNGLALCGVNLADFDPDMVKLFKIIYIWQDSDDPDSEAGRAWAKRLNNLVDVLGPLIRIIKTEAKDANEFLQAGATPDDLQALLKDAPEFLETEMARLGELHGADLYDQLEPLFCRLTKLDVFALTRYRSAICKSLNISQSDFSRYLKAAKGTLSDDEESEFAKGGQYTIVDGWTVLKQYTDDGKHKITPLANGSAKIIEEITNDDGSNDPSLDFCLAGELATGQKLPKITIPATEYAGMKWIAQWGSRFILSAGRATQDHFRAAVQHLSGTPYRRTIYTHTGWRKIGDDWSYLTSAGALGIADSKIQVDLKLGRPETNMVRYTLPAPQDITEAMKTSLKFWYIADLSITVPVWAAMFLAPLSPFLMIDFGLWMHGKSGSMKSSLVAACLSHFGQWQGKDAKILLPANFQSTANSILMNAFQAKDIPLIIDDFAPGATVRETRERDQVATNILRSVGNKAARGRMRDGRNFQADFPPRCLAIITAEDLPSTASIMARGIGIRVHLPPKGHPERTAIEKRLTQAQTQDSYQYPHAMAGFILWVQRHWDQLQNDLPAMAARYRDDMQTTGHSRLPDAFGKLMAAIDTALYFAMDCGAITQTQATQRKQQAFEALMAMMQEHGEAIEGVDACSIFRETLCDYLDARNWYLCPTNAETAAPPIDSPLGAICVGYKDDKYIYLLSKTVADIMQAHTKTGQPFPVGRNTLYQRLAERGWLIPDDKKTSTTVFIPVLNTSPRVLKFHNGFLE